jgi:hypothetical protein
MKEVKLNPGEKLANIRVYPNYYGQQNTQYSYRADKIVKITPYFLKAHPSAEIYDIPEGSTIQWRHDNSRLMCGFRRAEGN